MKPVYIILLNWNGWYDTIECLETIFRNDYPNYKVIVLDNDSKDDSLDYIKAWADNRLSITNSNKNILKHLTFPPLSKKIPYVEYDKDEAERGGQEEDGDVRLVFIRNRSNLGFAGGNNVGLRYVLARNDFDFVWLLNNDTAITHSALSEMVKRMNESPGAGICGSTLLDYHTPNKVQALGGGYYCKWIGLPWHQGRLKKTSDPKNPGRVEAWMNYVVGASMLVSKAFLQDIGLMCEDYYLYFEENDWALRAKGYYSLVYAPESVVYHKVGSSIGTSSNPSKKSYICDYYNIRNRLFFTRKYFPLALPGIYIVLLGTLFARVVLRRWDRVSLILRLMMTYNKQENELLRNYR